MRWLVSREGRDLGVAFQAPPGSQASSRGDPGLGRSPGEYYICIRTATKILRAVLGTAWAHTHLCLSSKGNQRGGCGRWEHWLLFRVFKKPKGTSLVVQWLRLCAPSAGGQPLVLRQGSQVSMRVARGSASWLSSHGRGLGPRDALKKDSRGLCRGSAGNPHFPRKQERLL